jgi:methylated-DNA-[protein]-cysteine S-methyltransferase
VSAHAADSRVVAVAIAKTRYAVRGWGYGELWLEDGVLLGHHFSFADTPEGFTAASDTASLVSRFRAFLRGEDVTFSDVAIDLDWTTSFQRRLVEALRAVPRGEVVSYGELAALAGRPRAPRAAGALCAANRFAFVVPCHRVVASNGIGGYGSAGVEVKRRLLALEGITL